LHGKERALYIDAEDLVEVRFGDLSQRGTSKDSEHRITALAGVKETRFSSLKIFAVRSDNRDHGKAALVSDA
jgi:hypothetical protein